MQGYKLTHTAYTTGWQHCGRIPHSMVQNRKKDTPSQQPQSKGNPSQQPQVW